MVVEFDKCNEKYDASQIRLAMNYLNDIAFTIRLGGYAPGSRNNIAVDLACVCHVLSIDAKLVARELVSDPFSLGDILTRLNKIDKYLDGWDEDGVFEYMTMDWNAGSYYDYCSFV